MVATTSIYVRKTASGAVNLSPGKPELMVMLGLIFLLCGCHPNRTSKQKILTFKAKGVTAIKEADSPFGTKSYNYTRIIEATGRGIPANDAISESGKRSTAIEAARYNAMAKIVEKIKGVNIKSRREVKDMQFSSEVIKAHTEGELKNLSLVSTKYNADTGIAYVTLRMGLVPEDKQVEVKHTSEISRTRAVRKIWAESAARTIALGKLAEQVGNIKINQIVKVEDLMFSSQQAWQEIQQTLEQVEYSQPRWEDDRIVTIEATLKVTGEWLNEQNKMLEGN